MCDNAFRQRITVRSSVRVAEKNLDRNRIAKQRLVNRDGPVNHCLNGCGVWIIDDRVVECWINDQSGGSLCRSRHHIRVPARTGASVRMHSIVVGRPWAQSGHNLAIEITDVQVVIAVHVTAERVAGGHIQQITFRTA